MVTDQEWVVNVAVWGLAHYDQSAGSSAVDEGLWPLYDRPGCISGEAGISCGVNMCLHKYKVVTKSMCKFFLVLQP